MNHIKKYNESDTEEIKQESLIIPVKTLLEWIEKLDMTEYDLNQRIYVKDDIENFLKNTKSI